MAGMPDKKDTQIPTTYTHVTKQNVANTHCALCNYPKLFGNYAAPSGGRGMCSCLVLCMEYSLAISLENWKYLQQYVEYSNCYGILREYIKIAFREALIHFRFAFLSQIYIDKGLDKRLMHTHIQIYIYLKCRSVLRSINLLCCAHYQFDINVSVYAPRVPLCSALPLDVMASQLTSASQLQRQQLPTTTSPTRQTAATTTASNQHKPSRPRQ